MATAPELAGDLLNIDFTGGTKLHLIFAAGVHAPDESEGPGAHGKFTAGVGREHQRRVQSPPLDLAQGDRIRPER